MKRLLEILNRKQEIKTRYAEVLKELDTNKEADIQALNKEVESLDQERSALDKEETEIRAAMKADAGSAKFRNVVEENKNEGNPLIMTLEERKNQLLASVEYREAFMTFLKTRGRVRPEILNRVAEFTTTSDVASVIVPTTITDKLFDTTTQNGTLFDRVTRTSEPFGISIKKTDTEFEIDWVAERGKTDSKKGATSGLSFTAFTGRIRFTESFLTRVMTLDAFEQAMAQRMLIGARKSFDKVIVNGNGTSQPKGILRDGVYTGGATKENAVKVKTITDHATWLSAFKKVPEAKKSSVTLVMNATDWYGYVVGMKDKNGRVVAFDTEGAGFNGMVNHMFLGRPVVLLEDQGLKTFDEVSGSGTMSADTAFAFFVDLKDYYLNMNAEAEYIEHRDYDTGDYVKDMFLAADGKLTETKSLAILCKDAQV